jgi:hypothetical protein
MWLDAGGLVCHNAQPVYQSIEPLHRRMHELAAELCKLKTQDRNTEMLEKLSDLYGLRDALLEQLKVLVMENRQWAVERGIDGKLDPCRGMTVL